VTGRRGLRRGRRHGVDTNPPSAAGYGEASRDTIAAMGKVMVVVAAILFVAWAVGGFLRNLR
jgi:hypothetical protein